MGLLLCQRSTFDAFFGNYRTEDQHHPPLPPFNLEWSDNNQRIMRVCLILQKVDDLNNNTHVMYHIPLGKPEKGVIIKEARDEDKAKGAEESSAESSKW